MYKVGGSLEYNEPSYVKRKADDELYQSLKKGEFCYVLNSRQMGKSSLLVKTKHQLENEDCQCASVDITSLGSENITVSQWYKGIISQLWRGFNLLGKVNLKQWFKEQENLSSIELLNYFITDILFNHFNNQNLIIFIDEIDSVLSLPFAIDDFFAFIRFCYNQRAIDPEYNRITFAIFGVATPSDLIKDRKRTPFNIGKAIELEGFTLEEIEPLIQCLNLKNGDKVMAEILRWTNGQPFLTQKICNLLVEISQDNINDKLAIIPVNEAFWIESIVRIKIIDKWQSQDEPEHLRTIRDRIYYNEQKAGKLLEIYQHILKNEVVESDNSREQIELILSGLVVNKNNQLIVKNKIYAEIFNLEWIDQQLKNLRPYSQTFDAWLASEKTDNSRLLRGQALKDALAWSFGKNIGTLDYQFIRQSELIDRQEHQQLLEAKNIKERLEQQTKNSKLQRLLLITISTALMASLGLISVAYGQYRKAQINEQEARISEIKALASSSQGQFASHQGLKSLIDAIKAKKRLLKIKNIDPNIKEQVDSMLRQALYGVTEYNQISGHKSAVWDLDYSKDGEIIATGSQDNTVKIWTKHGKLIQVITETEPKLMASALRADGKLIATANSQGTIKIWDLNGKLINSFRIAPQDIAIENIIFNPNGDILAVSNTNGTSKLYSLNGKLITTLMGHQGRVLQIKFSPDGQIIATTSEDHTVKLWHLNGTLIKTLKGHSSDVNTVSFSPNGQLLATGSNDNTVKLWSIEGKLLKTLGTHDSSVYDVAFSPDGKTIASVGWDKKIKLWSIQGDEIAVLEGHNNGIWRVAWNPDGKTLVSGAYDGEVKLWQIDHQFWHKFQAHSLEVLALAFTPDSKILASSGWDNVAKLWQLEGTLITTLQGHQNAIWGLDISPDGKNIITGSDDKTIKLWNFQGRLLKTIQGHKNDINMIIFSPDGKLFATGSKDHTAKIWHRDGTLAQILDHNPYIVDAIAFSPDSKLVVTTASDNIIRLWQIDGKLWRTFKGHTDAIWGVNFSPDGTFLASASMDSTVKLWYLHESKIITLKGHHGVASQLAISPVPPFKGDLTPPSPPFKGGVQGGIIASAGWDGTIKLWNRDGKLIKTLAGHEGAINTVAFSPDGKWLASGGDDKNIIIWNLGKILNLDELNYACDLVKDYLENNSQVEEKDRNLCN